MKKILIMICAVLIVIAMALGLYMSASITYKLTVVTDPNYCTVDIYRVSQRILTVSSGSTGTVVVVLPGGITYTVVVSKAGYDSYSEKILFDGSDLMTVTLTAHTSPPSENHAPIVNSIAGENTIEKGYTASYAVNADDSDGDTLTYKWEWGDGTYDGYTSSSTMSHSYDSEGSYTLKVTARDPSGEVGSKSISINVIESNSPPPSGSTDATATFSIKDVYGNPLQDVSITIKNEYNSITILTDNSGKASYVLEKGVYQVTIAKSGYKGVQSTANIDADRTISITLASSTSDDSSSYEEKGTFPVVMTILIVIFAVLASITLATRKIPFAILFLILLVVTIILYLSGIVF